MGYAPSSATSACLRQYYLIHDIFVMLDDGDRRLFSRFGISLPQYRVLKLLDLEDGQRLTSLSDTLLRAKSTITRIIDQLERDGLVQRTSDEEDRRAQRVILTPAGAALLAQARVEHARSIERRFGSSLTEEEQHAFSALLDRLHDGLVVDLAAQAEAGQLSGNHHDT